MAALAQHIGDTSNGTSGTTSTVLSVSKTVTVGNSILVGFGAWYNPSTSTHPTATDNLGNTYSRDDSIFDGIRGAHVFRAEVTTGGTLTTITVSHAAADYKTLLADEFSGVGTKASASGVTGAFSGVTSAVWDVSQTLPANGAGFGFVHTDGAVGHTAGAASGSPSTTPTLGTYRADGPNISGSTHYALAGGSAVTAFSGNISFGSSAAGLAAGANYNPASSPVTVTPGVASLTLTAYAPSVVVDGPKVVTPTTAALTLTTYAPTVSYIRAVGFGRNALSATARSDYHVTDGGNGTGAGTLRAALSASNRNIIFDVASVALATSELQLDNLTNIVIDGSSWSSGVTISGQALRFDGCRNIVIRHIAFRDCATQWEGALQFRDYAGTKSQDVLVDHCSFSGFAWRGVDFTEGTHHATVQWCFFGPNGDYSGTPPAYNYPAYVGDLSDRVSFDHCLFYNGGYRQPGAAYDMNEVGSSPSFVTMDVANCLIWTTQPAYDAGTAPYGYFAGTTALVKSQANVRQTYYHATAYTSDNHALYTERPASYPTSAEGFIYSSGNKFHNDAGSLVTTYTVGSAYAVESGAELTLESSATVAAQATLAGAGRAPRDATDTAFAANITLGVVTPTTASLTLTTFAPTVTGGTGLTVVPTTASLSLVTFAPSVQVGDDLPEGAMFMLGVGR